MTDLPETVTLEWIGNTLLTMRDEIRSLQRDVDMLTRIVLRVDSTVDALREDIKSLWLGQGDLRRRIEALERKP